jgi:DNA-binding transcriptional LysR family regulator
MNWDDLKYFLEVAQSGSLTKSGRALRASAATVARRIAALESGLGARLFDRRQSGYVLTDIGKAMRLPIQNVEDAVLTVERQALGHDLRPSGRVRVATTDDIATLVVAPRIAEFRKRNPDIALEIVARQDVMNLARRDADIALRLAPNARELFDSQSRAMGLGALCGPQLRRREQAEARASRPVKGRIYHLDGRRF